MEGNGVECAGETGVTRGGQEIFIGPPGHNRARSPIYDVVPLLQRDVDPRRQSRRATEITELDLLFPRIPERKRTAAIPRFLRATVKSPSLLDRVTHEPRFPCDLSRAIPRPGARSIDTAFVSPDFECYTALGFVLIVTCTFH